MKINFELFEKLAKIYEVEYEKDGIIYNKQEQFRKNRVNKFYKYNFGEFTTPNTYTVGWWIKDDKEMKNMKKENENIKYASEWMEIIRKNPKRYNGRKLRNISNCIITMQDSYHGKIMINSYRECLFVNEENTCAIFITGNTELELLPQYTNWDEARKHMENGGIARLNDYEFKIQYKGVVMRVITENRELQWCDADFHLSFIDSQEWELL